MTPPPPDAGTPEYDGFARIGLSLSEERDLPLSTWMGISGAAISTGLGRNTSLGLALLAGLSNVRLGVWWSPPTRRDWRLLLPFNWVQRYLFREFTGKFSGPDAAARRSSNSDARTSSGGTGWGWPAPDRLYLSDGGHFENTGIYSLVQRRVPLIIASDNGADPDYRFEDVVNLTRKLRIDLNADLEFLPKRRLDDLLGEEGHNRCVFGEISELLAYSAKSRSNGPYAAIARIRIPRSGSDRDVLESTGEQDQGYTGTLILLKPRLSGLETLDLLDYHRTNVKFPQQSTGDQFFDEAQWESYFRLGARIADLVFAEPPPTWPRRYWNPSNMEPVDPEKFPWFAEDWEPCASVADQATNGDGPPPVAGVQSVTPVGAAASEFGFWPLIGTAVASLGALGAFVGVGQSLTTEAIKRASSTSVTTMAMKIDSESQRILAAGVAVHLDADVTSRLDDMLARLDVLIAARRSGSTTVSPPAVVVDLQSIRALLARFVAVQNPAALQELLAEVRRLRDDQRAGSEALRAELATLDEGLGRVATEINRASPRRNARSGQ